LLGSNIPAHPGRPPDDLATLFQFADEWQCDCAQTYISLSRTWKVPPLLPEEVSSFKFAWQRSRVKQVVAHVPLIVNFASPVEDIWRRSNSRLSRELMHANELGIQALVLHPGSYGESNEKAGIERITDALCTVLDDFRESTTKLLLETTAGQGTAVGSRFEQIAQVLESVDQRSLLGLCLDTCHVFAAGYNFSGYKGYERVLKELDTTIGLSNLRAIHLNDSKTGFGSRVDRHAPVGAGRIGLRVFHALVSDSRFDGAPKILELPGTASNELQTQLELLSKLASTAVRTHPESEFIETVT